MSFSVVEILNIERTVIIQESHSDIDLYSLKAEEDFPMKGQNVLKQPESYIQLFKTQALQTVHFRKSTLFLSHSKPSNHIMQKQAEAPFIAGLAICGHDCEATGSMFLLPVASCAETIRELNESTL